MSLTKFTQLNDKLLTALAIFVSLTLFANSISSSMFGKTLSFLFFTLTIIVWLELWKKYPKKSTKLLDWFETTLAFALFLIIVYWFLEYRWITVKFIPTLAGLLMLKTTSFLIKRYNLFNRIFRTTGNQKPTLRYLIGSALVTGTILLTAAFQPHFDSFFNYIYKGMLK